MEDKKFSYLIVSAIKQQTDVDKNSCMPHVEIQESTFFSSKSSGSTSVYYIIVIESWGNGEHEFIWIQIMVGRIDLF